MPFPIILWGAAALGTAIAGKYIYDAVTEDGGSSSSSSSSSGPSREEVQQREKEAIYTDFQKEFLKFWQNEDQLLCLKDDDALTSCQKLPDQVRTAAITPARALEMLYTYECEKTCLNDITPIEDVEFFFTMSFFADDCESMIESINNSISLTELSPETDTSFEIMNDFFGNGSENENIDDIFPSLPRMAFADNYELCKDEGILSSLRAACAMERSEALGSLQGDWQRLTPELERSWNDVKNLEKADAEGSEPRVVVCGLLKAGKSSLLNALFDDPSNQHFPTAATRKTVCNQCEVLNGICFVDTPGLDHDGQDTKEAESSYAGADLLLFVHNGEKELEEQQLLLLQNLQAMHPMLEHRLLVVITYKEGAGENLQRLEETIRQKIRERCSFEPRIFAVDSRSYRHQNERVRATSGIAELRTAIEAYCHDRSDQLKIERKERMSAALSALTAAVNCVGNAIHNDRKKLTKQHNNIRKAFAKLVHDKKALVDGVGK